MDNQRIVELITLAKGERSVREFAVESGVAASYICELLKGRYIPSLKIVSRLAKVARNGVTYNQLVDAINGDSTDSHNIRQLMVTGTFFFNTHPDESESAATVRLFKNLREIGIDIFSGDINVEVSN